uniref:Uncharacterized protein n=1 Tax=Trichinella nativa TaxID=6335 RepID=A0A0V1KHA7_9BILA
MVTSNFKFLQHKEVQHAGVSHYQDRPRIELSHPI